MKFKLVEKTTNTYYIVRHKYDKHFLNNVDSQDWNDWVSMYASEAKRFSSIREAKNAIHTQVTKNSNPWGIPEKESDYEIIEVF